jgi:hypothetical protein
MSGNVGNVATAPSTKKLSKSAFSDAAATLNMENFVSDSRKTVPPSFAYFLSPAIQFERRKVLRSGKKFS